MQAVNVLAMVEDEKKAKAKDRHDVSSQGQEKEEKVSVVPPTNAVVYPWTMVVKVLHYERQ